VADVWVEDANPCRPGREQLCSDLVVRNIAIFAARPSAGWLRHAGMLALRLLHGKYSILLLQQGTILAATENGT
jgi:hypothetical protein